MLVEHGVPGVIFYLWCLWWTVRAVMKLGRDLRNTPGFVPSVLPGVAAIMAAVAVGDQFVSETKFEIRFWFLAVLMAMLAMRPQEQRTQEQRTEEQRREGRPTVARRPA